MPQLETSIELEFYSNFALEIETLVKDFEISYMDAVILWCEQTNTEISVGGELVKKFDVIREKIEVEAEDLNFLPRSSRLDF
jgi:hypothetical protein